MIENENTNYILTPRTSNTIFSSENLKNKPLLGDNKQFSGFDDDLIKSISSAIGSHRTIISQLDKDANLYMANYVEEIKNNNNGQDNNSTDGNQEEDEVNSLGEKVSSLSHIRKMSVEFLENLYKEGTTSSSSTESDANVKYQTNIKIEPDNPYVYSFTHHHRFSFFFGNKTYCYQKHKNRLLVPAPTLISNEAWTIKPDLSKHGITHEFKFTDNKGLVLVDPKVTVKFKGIVANMIKQILLAAFGNKISLPVRIFEPKCLLQRVGDYWSFANKFLVQASDPNISNIERFKLVVAFGLSSQYISCNQLKPFNPLLGETFQGEFESGGLYYIEHVSHRPLVSRFLVQHPKYQISGFFEYAIRPESLGSVLLCYLKGPVIVTFKHINQEITFNIPIIKLINTKSDKDRGAIWIGNMSYVDPKNNYRAVIKFCENKKKVHEVRGIIFSYKFPQDYKFTYEKEFEFGKKFNLSMTKNVKVLARVGGSWLYKITINDQQYWNIDEDVPEWIRPCKKCLPSDGRFREDFIWLYRSFYYAKNEEERLRYESLAQEWKILMEKFQRVERELRIKNKKKNK